MHRKLEQDTHTASILYRAKEYEVIFKKDTSSVKKYAPETVSLPCFSSSSAGKIILKEELCEDRGV